MPRTPPERGLGWAFALAGLAGVLHGASFPPAGVWPLAFVALGPLVAAGRDRRPAVGFALGWIEGTVAASIAVTPWITVATQQYFKQGPMGAVLFASLVGQVFAAMPSALFVAMLCRIGRLRGGVVRVLATAAAWTSIELLRAEALGGAPWDLLAHALYAHPLWIQIADLGGAFAVSFMLAVVGAAIGEVIVAPRAGAAAIATAGIVVAFTVGYGLWRLEGASDDTGPAVRIALVQGNVPNDWRGDGSRAEDAFRAFADATGKIVAEKPDLVVWPENAVSFLLAPNPRFVEQAAALLTPADAPLLLGGPRYAQVADGRVEFYNSAYLLSAVGESIAVYDKRHLVPFAEYVPIARVPGLDWRFNAPGGYTPGSTPTIFPRPDRFGVLICFEIIYPDLTRDLVNAGARYLVNLSNDAWFGTTAGLEQHFAISVFRAVEARRAVARATNTGVTAVVGPSGRVLSRFPAHVRDAWVARVPLRQEVTPYARMGDVFAWLAVAGALAAVVAGRPD